MEQGHDGPFRQLAVTTWSRPRGRFSPPAVAIGLLGVLFAALMIPLYGAVGACAAVPAIALVFSIPAATRYWQAQRRVQQLPFAVHHLSSTRDPFSLNRIGIDHVSIVVAHELAPAICDVIAGDAERRIPGLSATVHADRGLIRLGRWAWGGEDLSALAELLETWGRELHDRATILRVDVHWRAGAPV